MLSMCKNRVVEPIHRAGPHYVCLMISGFFGLIYPPPSIDSVTFGRYAIYFWLGSLAVGGTLCVIGRWRGSRGPKILGIGLILSSLGTYMIALIPSWPEAAANFWLIAAFSFMLLYRQSYVRKERDADLELRRRASARSDMAANSCDDPPIPGAGPGRADRNALADGPGSGAQGDSLSA